MKTKTRRPPTEAEEQARCDLFNEAYPVGTFVAYWRGFREGEPSGIGKTRVEAQLSCCDGAAVVWIEGCAGYISLSHVEPRPSWEPRP